MGLITGLVTLPLAPARGVVWLAEKLWQEAFRQWTDPATIRRELQATHELWSTGAISDEERARTEDELLGRLMAGHEAGGRNG